MRIIEKPEEFRSNVREKLCLLLKDKKTFSTNLEKGIFNYALKEATSRNIIKKWDNPYFVQLYTDHLRSIFLNITKNSIIMEQVENGDIKPHIIAFMTHQELQPSKWEKMIELKMKRDKYKFENTIEASTSTFTCRKCKSKKCMYYQQQTRSADEPMTTFVTCIDCGNRWKC